MLASSAKRKSSYRVRLLPRSQSSLFTVLLYLYILIAVPYLAWRFSIINWHVWYGPLVYAAELYNGLMTTLFLFISRTIELPIFRPSRPSNHTIDVFVPTYNEPLEILEPTVRAALAIRGIRNVLVLDDGNRAWTKAMAQRLGAAYHARTTNRHAKAGNMNNGLASSNADFIICLDADHVPVPQFAERTLGYFDDAKVAFVQGPQRFYNTGSFLFRKTRRGLWSEQGMFYDVLQPAKNRFNAAFFVGTTAMLRRKALNSVGGFATGTATEDIHTSLRLHAKGWKSVFVNEPLAYGLEAENLKEYFRQRRRWAAGSLGLLVRSPDSPLRARGLTLVQRLNYLSATLAHLLGIQKLFYFWLPILCIVSLGSPTSISWALAAQIMIVFAIFSIAITAAFARGTYHLLYTEAYNLANFLAHIAGAWGIIKVQKKFSVSRKIVRRGERTGLKTFLWGLLIIAVLAIAEDTRLLEAAFAHHAAINSLLVVSLVFLVYNLVILWTFFGYLLNYERQKPLAPPSTSDALASGAPPAVASSFTRKASFYESLPATPEPQARR